MGEVSIAYIQRVFCIVEEDTGEVARVIADEALCLDENNHDCLYDVSETGSPYQAEIEHRDRHIPLYSDRGKRAIEIAESVEWPAWDL